MPERILFYWAKTYSSTISSGDNYRQLTPVIFISILNYPLFSSETDKFHTIFHIREETENFIWSNQLEFHVFDLSSFVVQWRKSARELKKRAGKELPWLLMLSAVDFQKKKLDRELFSDLEEWAMTIEQVREALVEWETLSANKENRMLFEARTKELRDLLSNLEGERRLGREEGIEKGIEKGIQKGRTQEKHEVALKMLREGIEATIVMKVTGLSVDELKKFSEEN